jgi:hypothetical protein
MAPKNQQKKSKKPKNNTTAAATSTPHILTPATNSIEGVLRIDIKPPNHH